MLEAITSSAQAYQAYRRAVMYGKAGPRDEQLIKSDAYSSNVYARDVVKGRWEAGEATIATDAAESYYYALTVVRGRWEPGEAAIATNANYARMYVANIIQDRWEPCEPTLTKAPDLCKDYIRMVLDSDDKYKTDPDFMAFVLTHG